MAVLQSQLIISPFLFLWLVLLTSAYGFREAIAALDPCTILSQSWNSYYSVASPAVVRSCLDSLGSSSSADVTILDSIIRTVQSVYPFTQGSLLYPDPRLPGAYDVLATLRDLRAKAAAGKFKTSRLLHERISAAISGLNDAHAAYIAPCFLPAAYQLPFPLVSSVEAGTLKIRVAPFDIASNVYSVELAFYLPPTSALYFDILPFLGAAVLKIDGVDAVTALGAYANKSVGMLKDQGARFNSLFAGFSFRVNQSAATSFLTASPGSFVERLLPPPTDTTTFLVLPLGSTTPVSISVPWLAFPLSSVSNFIDSRSYRAANCVNVTCLNPSDNPARAYVKLRPEFQQVPPQRLKQNSLRRATTGPITAGYNPELPGATLLSTKGDYFKVFFLSDNKTAVITIPDFLLDVGPFAGNISRAFSLVPPAAKQVILDVRGNGGGIAANSAQLLLRLFGSVHVPLANFTPAVQFFHGNRLIDDMVAKDAGWYNRSFWADTDQVPFAATNKTFFYPLRTEQWVPRIPRANYSSFVKEDVRYLYSSRVSKGLGSRALLVLSDGLCFSTCNFFTSNLNVMYKVKVVAVGGLPGRKMSFAAACGYVSYDYNCNFIQQIPAAAPGRALGLAPGPFLNGTNLGLPFAGARIPASSKIQCEFQFYAPDVQIPYTPSMVANPAMAWSAAARYF